jgi:hypothetical protein
MEGLSVFLSFTIGSSTRNPAQKTPTDFCANTNDGKMKIKSRNLGEFIMNNKLFSNLKIIK